MNLQEAMEYQDRMVRDYHQWKTGDRGMVSETNLLAAGVGCGLVGLIMGFVLGLQCGLGRRAEIKQRLQRAIRAARWGSELAQELVKVQTGDGRKDEWVSPPVEEVG